MVNSFADSSPSSHHRVKHLFLQAIAFASKHEALDFIQGQCGSDFELLSAVERLLDAHWEPERSLLETIDEQSSEQLQPLRPGQSLRGYTIERLVGEGGMGLVYLGHQSTPFERKVAIKVLKRGIDTREVLKRFLIEQQALATLDHPNIARIIDGGQTESGLPYFIMEYVDGQPLTSFCDAQKKSIRERLRLWLDAAEAVQHAHICGILHRDLKPSNILVSKGERERATVKVIDFGLAKLAETPSGFSLVSRVQACFGTPRYMSPEQKGTIAARIDTRTDVFAMGIILRELLIGGEASRTAETRSKSAMQHSSYDPGPQFPSRLFMSLSPPLRSLISSQRDTDTRTLAAALRGELDWIVVKSLCVNPEERYQSISEFAGDVTAHLNGHFVHARPPSMLYRWRKALFRHRTLASSLMLIFLVAIAVAAISRKQTLVSRNAEQRAKTVSILLERSQRRTQQLLYASDLRLAGEAWVQGDTLEARTLLDRHAPRRSAVEGDGFFQPGIEWFFLNRQLSLSETLYSGGSQRIERMAAVMDKGICFQANDSQIWLWSSGKLRDAIGIHSQHRGNPQKLGLASDAETREWSAIASSLDGSVLAVGSETGDLYIYDMRNRRVILETNIPGERLFSLRFLSEADTLAVGTTQDVIVVDLENGHIRSRLNGHHDDINALCYSPASDLLVSASEDRRSIVWDTVTGECVSISPVAAHRLTATTICSSGDFWVDADVKGTVRMLSTSRNGEAIRSWLMPSAIDCLALSPNERRLAVGSRTGSIHVLSLEEAAVPKSYPSAMDVQIPVHAARVTEIVWENDDTFISAGRDGCLRRTTVEDTHSHMVGQDSPVMRNCVSSDGRLVGFSDQHGVYIYNVSDKDYEMEFVFEESVFCSTIAMKPMAQEMIAVTRDGVIYRFAAAEQRKKSWLLIEQGLIEPPLDISQLEFTADGSRILAASRTDDIVRIYDRDFSRQILEIEFKGSHASMASNGRWFAVNHGRDLLVYDTESGELVSRSVSHHNETITSLAFSPDCQRIITTSDDRTIRSWQWIDEKDPTDVGVHPDGVPKALAISSDGRTAVTCSRNGQAWLWSLDVGQKLLQVAYSGNGFESCSLSDNDRLLVLQDSSGKLIFIPIYP